MCTECQRREEPDCTYDQHAKTRLISEQTLQISNLTTELYWAKHNYDQVWELLFLLRTGSQDEAEALLKRLRLGEEIFAILATTAPQAGSDSRQTVAEPQTQTDSDGVLREQFWMGDGLATEQSLSPPALALLQGLLPGLEGSIALMVPEYEASDETPLDEEPY